MDNEALQDKYDEMHSQGPSAWFDDGRIERELIIRLGDPWTGLDVLEIGCGEGDLLALIQQQGASICVGVDYSETAVRTARNKHPDLEFSAMKYSDLDTRCDCLVMQGVMEHLDDPFGELDWMIERFQPECVITTSPGFLNPRGIVWMTLHMLGAIMSKTDLHFLHPWQFQGWAKARKFKLTMESADHEWGYDSKMINDLKRRIPLALKDGGIENREGRFPAFLAWLEKAAGTMPSGTLNGAVIGYRIDL